MSQIKKKRILLNTYYEKLNYFKAGVSKAIAYGDDIVFLRY